MLGIYVLEHRYTMDSERCEVDLRKPVRLPLTSLRLEVIDAGGFQMKHSTCFILLVHSHCSHVSIISSRNEATLNSPRAASTCSCNKAMHIPNPPCITLQRTHDARIHRSPCARIILRQPVRRRCRVQAPNRPSSQPVGCARGPRG